MNFVLIIVDGKSVTHGSCAGYKTEWLANAHTAKGAYKISFESLKGLFRTRLASSDHVIPAKPFIPRIYVVSRILLVNFESRNLNLVTVNSDETVYTRLPPSRAIRYNLNRILHRSERTECSYRRWRNFREKSINKSTNEKLFIFLWKLLSKLYPCDNLVKMRGRRSFISENSFTRRTKRTEGVTRH